MTSPTGLSPSRSPRTYGVWAVHIETGQVVAFLKEEDAVQELFAVQVLPGIRFPEMLDRDEEHLATAVVLPDEALADVPPPRLNHSKFTGEKPLNS